MLEVLLTACLLICAIIIYWRARLVESRAHPLPPAYPGLLPIIGHTHLLLTDTEKLWPLAEKCVEFLLQHGGVIYGKFGTQIYYIISDPEDALLVANTCLEKHFAYRFVKFWLGEGLVTGSGDHWHRHRQELKSSFSVSIINGYIEVFNSQSRALLNEIDRNVGKGKFDPSPYMRQFTLGISYWDSNIYIFKYLESKVLTEFQKIVNNFNYNLTKLFVQMPASINLLLNVKTLTTFGKVADKNFCPKYMKAVDGMLFRMMQRFQKPWLHYDFIHKLLGEQKQDSKLATIVNGISDEIIHMKRSFLNGTNRRPVSTYVSYQPLLDQILEQNTRNRFTDQEITEELHTAIAAAFETTSHSLDNILVMIGSFPKVQQRMFEEIMQVLGTDSDVAKEDLMKLVYTDAVIKESMRMIPTVPVILRYIDRDVKLKNYTLRSGSQCILLLHGLHRHPSWGLDADKFRPERWLDTATLPTNKTTDAAFSFGKRSCLGKTYAMTALKIAVAHMVRKYFITADYTKMQFKIDVTLHAVSGHEITLKRRS